MNIVIVGGGTAGWMCANLMAVAWANKNIHISLVESPQIGIIGVGEGSTPQLKDFFDEIGIEENQWMTKCNATYKTGITFAGWSTKPGFSQYFHPFPSELDVHTQQAFFYHCLLRRQGVKVAALPDDYFVQAQLAKMQKGPIPHDSFPFGMSYGYHFDSVLMGAFLRDIAVEKSVTHIQAKVEQVFQTSSGDIQSLLLDNGTSLSGDFFIDCSGFNSILLQQTLGVKFSSFNDNLFNDSAVVLPTKPVDIINSHTISTALKYGWSWDIPLQNRTGNGYVYSSSFCSKDQAEQELREKLGLLNSDVEARHLSMKVGQVEKHWYKNCLAIGLSQGFIEPLEATALHLVHSSIDLFMRNFESGHWTNQHQNFYNQTITARFDGIRDYIVAHYRVNSRTDTEYWRANACNENLSYSLKSVLRSWLNREDVSKEVMAQGIDKYYSPMSWHCLLAGYGVFPDESQLIAQSQDAVKFDMSKLKNFILKSSIHYPSHNEQIDRVGRTVTTY